MRWELSEEGKGGRDRLHSKGESEEAGLRHGSASGVCARLQLKPSQLLPTHPPPLQARNVHLLCKSTERLLRSRGKGFVLCLHWPITMAQKGTAVFEISRDTSDSCQANLLYCKHGVLLEQYQW